MANGLSQRQRAFEVLLADLSSRFANVPNDAVESQIEIALRQLIAFFGFDRSSFAEFDAEGRLNVLCSVSAKGVEPLPLGPMPSFLGLYVREARSGKMIVLRSAEDLPPEASHMGISSSVRSALPPRNPNPCRRPHHCWYRLCLVHQEADLGQGPHCTAQAFG